MRRPLDSLGDCGADEVEDFDDWRALRQAIAAALPQLVWRRGREGYTADGSSPGGGRFELRIAFDTSINADYNRRYGKFRVRGSQHADQVALIRRIAAAVNFSAFDMQTGELIQLQQFPEA